MAVKFGKQSYKLSGRIYINETACIVGPREKEGPLGEYFDQVEREDYGEDTWEKGEAHYIEATFNKLMGKISLDTKQIDCVFSGDLLNQCMASAIGLKNSNVPFLGLYGACSTMAESMLCASLCMDSNAMTDTIAITSSNFCSAEKQYRFPLELGGQRTPTSQWTVTASGAVYLSCNKSGAVEELKPYIESVTIGKIENYKINDVNNMGAVMAPACASTILSHLRDLSRTPDYYDLILTGDLGYTGSKILLEIMSMHGNDISTRHNDCGKMIFDSASQDTKSGGSGCGCAAAVFTSYIYKLLKNLNLRRVLFVATGALISPVMVKQGEDLLAISHGISIEI
ncbi:MAG: stage V sporulation protein AD [Clostridia bacterium]|nr:stage V sporulation protein AD [Clostridia bacterium]